MPQALLSNSKMNNSLHLDFSNLDGIIMKCLSVKDSRENPEDLFTFFFHASAQTENTRTRNFHYIYTKKHVFEFCK